MPASSEEGCQVGPEYASWPCIPAGMQLQKAVVGPTSGPAWRLSHFGRRVHAVAVRGPEAVDGGHGDDLPAGACTRGFGPSGAVLGAPEIFMSTIQIHSNKYF
jgi:hypothetical protein